MTSKTRVLIVEDEAIVALQVKKSSFKVRVSSE